MNLKSFDLHAKVRDDARITTSSGGAVFVISFILILLLCSSELLTYLTTPPKEILTVDTERSQRLPIFFNLTFPRLACSVISIDTSDVSGEEHQDIEESIYKIPINHEGETVGAAEVISNVDGVATPMPDPNNIPEHVVEQVNQLSTELAKPGRAIPTTINIHDENYCGDCYGAGLEGECCNTCEDVRRAYAQKGWVFNRNQNIVQCNQEALKESLDGFDKSGCQIAGQITVAKVKGKLMFTPSKMNMHIHHMVHQEHNKIVDTSHTIHYLRFGSKLPNYKEASPLDRHESIITEPETTAAFTYNVNIVPTSFEKSSGGVTRTNQYAVTQEAVYMSGGEFHDIPGVFFQYDISPIRVHVIQSPRSLITTLTNLAAILGGIFTISGIIDSFLFHTTKKTRY
eukprot:c34544_g1_i1.p1 GENE.c34544_g1_i1~~c34544_g1_i1.p1  ORF type:complete len:400 (+),score=106.00 c34544_g1_i1:48-1247(+)